MHRLADKGSDKPNISVEILAVYLFIPPRECGPLAHNSDTSKASGGVSVK